MTGIDEFTDKIYFGMTSEIDKLPPTVKAVLPELKKIECSNTYVRCVIGDYLDHSDRFNFLNGSGVSRYTVDFKNSDSKKIDIIGYHETYLLYVESGSKLAPGIAISSSHYELLASRIKSSNLKEITNIYK